MAKQLEGSDFVQVSINARRISDAAICAYWSDATEDKYFLEHHKSQMQEGVKDLCEVMGLRVIDAEESPATEEAA